MSEKYKLESYDFAGSAEEVGKAQGEAFKTSLVELMELRLDSLSSYMKLSKKGLLKKLNNTANEMWSLLEKFDIQAYEVARNIVDVCDIKLNDYLICANMTDFRDEAHDPEGCTSAIIKNRHSHFIGAQTWDLNESNLPYIAMVHEKIDNSLERWTLNCKGFPALMGMNEKGVAVGTTNIKTSDIGQGLGYLHIIDKALKCETALMASQSINNTPRLASHTYWIVDREEGVQIDTGHSFYQSLNYIDEPIVRTNHPIPKFLSEHQLELPCLSSLMRKKRAEDLFSVETESIKDIKNILADRAHGVNAISRLKSDTQGITTNACFIAIPEKLKIWACRGPSQQGIWEEFELKKTTLSMESAS